MVLQEGNKLNKHLKSAFFLIIAFWSFKNGFSQNVNDTTLVKNSFDMIKDSTEIQFYTDSAGTFVDERDGQTYGWIKVGNQIWMTENLKYKADSGCYVYKNRKRTINKFGYLYTWETAKKIAPVGWCLPSEKDFGTLFLFLDSLNCFIENYPQVYGNSRRRYDCLKEYNHLNFVYDGMYWAEKNKFMKALFIFNSTTLWTSSYYKNQYNLEMWYFFEISKFFQTVAISSGLNPDDGLPIRCIKDLYPSPAHRMNE